jgi:group I intron endonuclease
MIIYKTLNTVNGKYYIGMDTKNDPNYLGSGTLLKQAIQKYGKDSFKKIILEQCDSVEQLKEQEKYWISTYNACSDRESYNISTGGTGGDNFTHNPDKELIREKLQARRRTDATKKKISENNWQKTNPGPRTGTEWSEEQRGKMEGYWKNNSSPFKGKSHTEEAKQKNREKHLGKRVSEETRSKMIASSSKGQMYPKTICPYCGKEGGGNAMAKWHFNNCKNKQHE